METENNDWGLDPSVRRMRRVFSEMESAQGVFLEQLKITLFDKRLRPAREAAKVLFHRTWSLSATKGPSMSDEETAGLYIHCLAWALRQAGVRVPSELLPDDESIRVLVKEALT